MVITYFDSSVLLSMYLTEQFSQAARHAVRDVAQVPFTRLHELEMSNALELLVGRKVIKRDQQQAVQAQIYEDLGSARFIEVSLEWGRVFLMASQISRTHSAKLLTRSLDLLHVAAAQVAMCTTFVSADDRQIAAAGAVGLKVVDIKSAGPPSHQETKA
jgi:predicted nucleic acid-binding protein